MARVLSKDLPFSRIDFYEINGNPYFGKLLFTQPVALVNFVRMNGTPR